MGAALKRFITFVFVLMLLSVHSAAQADMIEFELTGNGGHGLLESNIDPPTGEVGTGDVGVMGIVFDTLTNDLRIHVEWGSEFGYTDLSEDSFKLHLHGPTPDSAPGSYGQIGPLADYAFQFIDFQSFAHRRRRERYLLPG